MTQQDNLLGSWLCCKLKIHLLLLFRAPAFPPQFVATGSTLGCGGGYHAFPLTTPPEASGCHCWLD